MRKLRWLSNLSKVPQQVEQGSEPIFGASAYSLPEEWHVSHSSSGVYSFQYRGVFYSESPLPAHKADGGYGAVDGIRSLIPAPPCMTLGQGYGLSESQMLLSKIG